ncbi:MAG: DUF4870 domain-containing protein [Pirellulales bacterium]|nr:DUF4870 domain-containing protein [Pirellulales bacterium]
MEPQTPNPDVSSPQGVTESSKDERTLAMLCHLLALITGFIGPLVLWLIKKDEMPLVDDQGKESLNFQITVLLAMIVCGVLTCVIIGAFLAMAVGIADIVYVIIAAVKANEGHRYRYPVCLRLVK